MNFEWKIALRFLKEGKGQTMFILLGISIGIAVMVFLSTLISGLQDSLIEQTIGSSAHIWITGQSDFDEQMTGLFSENVVAGNSDTSVLKVSDWQRIVETLNGRSDLEGITPVVEGNAFYTSKGEIKPIVIKGFEQQGAEAIYGFGEKLVEGNSNYEGNNILVGTEFAAENELSAGDVIQIAISADNTQTFTINGIFDLGSSGINSTWVVMSLGRAQKIFAFGNDVSKIEMQVNEIFEAKEIGEMIDTRLNSVTVENWIDANESLLVALQSQSSSSNMIQAFVLLSITLGIASVLAVSVMQKSKQLGILKAMGTGSGQASRIFLLQGAVLGVVGSGLGLVLGIGLIEMFLWGTSLGGGEPTFPLALKMRDILIIALIASVASTIAAFVPAKKSSKLSPVEVIRNG